MHVHIVTVRLKNGSPDLSEGVTPILPSALIKCEGLRQKRSKRGFWPKGEWTFVMRAVAPLLYARIEPEPEHYAGGLLNPRGAIQAEAIELSSVSFENGPIPTITAYAQFQMTFNRAFADTGEFYDWQEQTDFMDWALCFGFRLEDGGEWDATWKHDGVDFEIVAP